MTIHADPYYADLRSDTVEFLTGAHGLPIDGEWVGAETRDVGRALRVADAIDAGLRSLAGPPLDRPLHAADIRRNTNRLNRSIWR